MGAGFAHKGRAVARIENMGAANPTRALSFLQTQTHLIANLLINSGWTNAPQDQAIHDGEKTKKLVTHSPGVLQGLQYLDVINLLEW